MRASRPDLILNQGFGEALMEVGRLDRPCSAVNPVHGCEGTARKEQPTAARDQQHCGYEHRENGAPSTLRVCWISSSDTPIWSTPRSEGVSGTVSTRNRLSSMLTERKVEPPRPAAATSAGNSGTVPKAAESSLMSAPAHRRHG